MYPRADWFIFHIARSPAAATSCTSVRPESRWQQFARSRLKMSPFVLGRILGKSAEIRHRRHRRHDAATRGPFVSSTITIATVPVIICRQCRISARSLIFAPST